MVTFTALTVVKDRGVQLCRTTDHHQTSCVASSRVNFVLNRVGFQLTAARGLIVITTIRPYSGLQQRHTAILINIIL